MKTTLCFTLTLLIFVTLAFVPNSFAQDASPEYVVRVIYFIPKDREPKFNINTKFDAVIRDVQQFYADVMKYHGFGEKTFRFETDDSGNAIVHHVNGKLNETDYRDNLPKAWDEIDEQFGISRNIDLVALDTHDFGGLGWGSSHSGKAIVAIDAVTGIGANDSALPLIVHELGHAFGLQHDIREEIQLPPFVQDNAENMVSSFCAAEWLDVNRYFNDSQNAFNDLTSVEMFTPTVAVPPLGISLQFHVTDPDGLHQAQLVAIHHGNSYVIGCKQLNGISTTIEFTTTQLLGIKSVALEVIDKNGNFVIRAHQFPVDITPFLPPSDPVSIPDPNLASAIRLTFSLAPEAQITKFYMEELKTVFYLNNQITDITGLEHAINLLSLSLYDNQISDIAPLAALKNMEYLHLSRNHINDITPLAQLTRLETLWLDGNEISDITPLAALKNMDYLYITYNQISDITPLAQLTRLETLWIGHNQISDITPLVGLTNLTGLEVQSSQISDITPLKGLTKLRDLYLGWNKISDITPIENLTELSILQIRDNKISDIAPIVALKQLENVNLHDNQISDITPLTGLTKLNRLSLSNNQISDVSPLTGLTKLNSLSLSNNQISDVSPLAELVNLEELYLEGNPIKNRKPLLELLRKNPDVKIYITDKTGNFKVLPVTLSHFRAEHTADGVLLKWTTESEVDNAGFYIYRSQTKDGEFKVVNPSMIQGAGTTSERNEYTWKDTTAKPNVAYYYRIEDISHAGVRKQLATVRMRGLVSATGKLTTRWADLKTHD